MAPFKPIIFFVTVAFLIHQIDSQSAFNYDKCTVTWNDIGCSIGFHRNLKSLQDDRKSRTGVKINWDDWDGYKHDLKCRCRRLAANVGYEWFAINPYGICLSQGGSLRDYMNRFPLFPENSTNCRGMLSQTPAIAPDGSQCILGGYRAFFYEIQKNRGGDVTTGAPEETEATAPPEPTAGAETTAAPEPTVTPTIACTKYSDVFLVVDSSGSVNVAGFNKVKTFLKLFLARYDLTKSRIGILTYDHNCYLNLDWTQSSQKTKSQIRDVIDSIPYQGGGTRTDVALNCTRHIIQAQQRPDINKTVCVMTDGLSWNGDLYVTPEVQKLKAIPNLSMVAIGVGDQVNDAELDRIRGSNGRKFKLADFQDLLDKAATTLNDIISFTCR